MPGNDHKVPNDAVALEMGARVAATLRQRYPKDAAKLIARDFSVSPHTARRWLTGALPENRHLLQLMRVFGKRVAYFLLEPVTGPLRHIALEAEFDDLRDRLARIEALARDEESDAQPAVADHAEIPSAPRALPHDARRMVEGPPVEPGPVVLPLKRRM